MTLDNQPVPSTSLCLYDTAYLHGAGENYCRNQAEAERHLVRNHLYGTTHGRNHRVLVVRCPTSEEHTQNADRTYGCDEEYTYVEVKNMSSLVPWKE